MNIFKEIYQAYKTIKYRSKIVNINISDLITSNSESSCAIYKGFFGEPMIDSDLLIANKTVKNANKHRAREYWSPRYRGILSWGSIGKQLTHEKDRMRDKKIVQDEIKNLDEEKGEKQD